MEKESKKISQRVRFSFVKILTGSDLSLRRLPLMAVESKNSGPVVWLTGCVHGDEVGGIAIIQEIFKKIRKRPLLKGSLYAFPIMNPVGFETVSRHIALSKEDLNRSFPGNERGSVAERIAYKIFTTITQTNPTIVLDLHNDWRESLPYAFIDAEKGITDKETYEKTKIFAKKTGLPAILDVDVIEHSLTFSLINKGIPALTLELGESYVVIESNVEYGIKAVLNILSHLEMTPPPDKSFGYPMPETIKNKILKYSYRPASSTSGIIRFLVKPVDFIKKNQPLAKIYNTFGKLLETLKAPSDCILLGYSDFSIAFPGTPIISLGII